MATIEPNREWYQDLAGKGPVKLEFPNGETFVVSVDRGESDD